MTELQQLEDYTRLLDRKQFSLTFPKEIEKAYQTEFRRQFLTANKKLVTFGVFFYMSFIFADYFFFNEQFVNLTLFRTAIFLICLTLLYTVYFKENYKRVVSITLICNTAMGAQMFMSGILFFEQPLNMLYAVGVFPTMVYGIILFQVCYKETMIIVLTLFSGLLLTIMLSYPFETNNQLFQMLLEFMPLLIIFSATICAMGIYTSYSMEGLNRKNWLKNQLLELDSKRLNKLTEQLKALSITDGLTNLYNRRFFDEQLLKHWQLCKAQNQPISLVMLDVDWFKAYNDTYGHGQGDKCLKSMSYCLQSNSPDSAIVARYGGEEFIVILPNTAPKEAQAVAEMLRASIFDLKIPHKNSPLNYCTVSVGVDTRHPAKTSTHIPKDDSNWVLHFLQHVDNALYAAKAKGKNQVCVYSKDTKMA